MAAWPAQPCCDNEDMSTVDPDQGNDGTARLDDGRSDQPPNGVHWSTPGGGLNPGEDYASGAARELAEETG